MKVAMIDPSAFTPPYDHHLCRGLSKAGCDVTLMTSEFEYTGWENETDYRKVEMFYNKTNEVFDKSDSPIRKVFKGIEHISDEYQLVQQLKRIDPDIIHFQWLPVPIVDQWVMNYLRGVAPVVYTVHDTTPYHGAIPSRFQVWGVKSAPSKCDYAIVHTEDAKSKLKERGIPKGKIAVVPHGTFHYPQSNRKKEKKEDMDVILFFGAIKEYKGIDILLRAFDELDREYKQAAKIRIAGSASFDIAEIRNLAVELGIEDHIEWDIRYIPDREVSQLFESSDVIAFPYRNADQSGALMTALPYGKPIVASDVGGFSEVLEDGVHGHVVESENVKALSEALRDLIGNEEKQNQMGKSVKELAETYYSWVEIGKQTREVYEELIDEES